METGVAVSGGSLSLPGTTAFRAAFNTLATGDPGDPALATTWVRAENELLHAQQVLNPALSAANPPGSALAGVNTSIGQSFASIARMIRNPNVPTRVYMTGMGGFDTHTNQLPTQAALLGQLDAAVSAFHTDMAKETGAGVVTLVVSEFGRRLNANADLGTDHGTCAPVLVLGAPVLGGLYGAQPSLTALDRQGDPITTTDFRSIYSTVLQRTLKTDAATILGSSASRRCRSCEPVARVDHVDLGDAVAAEKGVAALDDRSPDLEILLVMGPVAFFVGVLELVESGILHVSSSRYRRKNPSSITPASPIGTPSVTRRPPAGHLRPYRLKRPAEVPNAPSRTLRDCWFLATEPRETNRCGGRRRSRARASSASETVKRPS